MKSRLFWLIPVGLVILLLGFVAALPSLVSSTANRATIEALAGQLTGRPVRINGSLALDLFPEPRLIAQNIVIGGPDHEIITADSLTLDIAVTALLRGHLSAKTLSLQRPKIQFPWPLPGGAAAIAPPPWLTTLHAQIADGTISVGKLRFDSVNADIFTGAGGALSVSGTGSIQAVPVTVSLALAALDAAGSAPVSIDAAAGPASMHLSGTFNAASALAGTVSLTATATPSLGAFGQSVYASAAIQADPEQVTLTKVQAAFGVARLAGTATLALDNPILTLSLTGTGVPLPTLDELAPWSAAAIPIYLALDVSGASLGGLTIPHLTMRAEFSAAGANISALNAILPGNASLSLTGTLDPAGMIAGHLGLDANDFPALLAAAGAPAAAPDAWRQASLTARISGTLTRLRFQRLSGTLGAGYVTGTLLLDRTGAPARLAGALHFDNLDLDPFSRATAPPAGGGLSADLEITADRAQFRQIRFTRLLIDASFGDHVIVRRFSASLHNGIMAANFSVAPNGDITAARAELSVPSAVPLAALLPAGWQPPPAVTRFPLFAAVLAAGPPSALQTNATLTLGDFNVTAAPVLDLGAGTAAGAFTLRHPSAIAALKLFGLDTGLAWPGAGSISVRAAMLYGPAQAGLQDFVLSMGDLTATGKLLIGNGHTLDADVDAGTLALPPWPADASGLWSALPGLSGKISLSADQVLLAGMKLFGATSAGIALQPAGAVITITGAKLAGGTLSGQINAAAAAPPDLKASLTLAGADATQFSALAGFPLALASGAVSVQAKLTAIGYGPQTWQATLSGPASLSARSGVLTGFCLPALTAAMTADPRAAALTEAATTGATAFNSLAVAGTFSHGLLALTSGSLQSPAGGATATGSVDFPDQDISLNLALQPAVPNPPIIGLALVGPWFGAQKIAAVHDAVGWSEAK